MSSPAAHAGKARAFYYEICRCIPFIQRAMHLEELVTVKEMRSVVAAKFRLFSDVTDPRVIDRLIFKGREELEVWLQAHKNRHHAITEYFDPILQRKRQEIARAAAGGAERVAPGSAEAQARQVLGAGETGASAGAGSAAPSPFLSAFLQGNHPRPTGL